MVTTSPEVTYLCSQCGHPTEWDELLGVSPLCPDCWDRAANKYNPYAAWQRKYYQERKEEHAARQRKYRQEHKEESAAWLRKYRQEHKEEYTAWQRKYYQEHKEEYTAWQRKYRQEHKEEYAQGGSHGDR